MMETERLLIRLFQATDGPALYAYLSDPEVVRFEPYEPLTREMAEKEAVGRGNNPAFWAICLRDTGELIGNLYLAAEAFDAYALGYVFAKRVWGKGYATEAASAMLDRVFSEGAHRVYAECDPQNTPSWRLLERLGMRREAHFRSNVYFRADPEPEWKDTYVYAILNSEWRKKPC